MSTGSSLPGRQRSRQRRLADRRDSRAVPMHGRATSEALRSRAVRGVRVHVRREAAVGRPMVRRPAAAPPTSKVLHGRRVPVHQLVVDMRLRLILWRQSVWSDLECARLPGESVEPICESAQR